ncbi:MAG: hypothetical protein J6X55_02390 [Victivallales bacterium]|nr:hypothetical protein [Victivallales bacterium]
MRYKKIIWLFLFAVFLVTGVYVIVLARHRNRLLATLDTQTMPETSLGQRTMQVVQRNDESKLEKDLHRHQKAVRLLTNERETWKRQLEHYEYFFHHSEEPSLEEFREAQPEEYEKLKRDVARILRFASAKKRLREEYMARLDYGVLTDEERETLINTLENVAEAEDFLLEGGDGELELYYKAGRMSFADFQQWLHEGSVVNLAAMADWKSAGGTKHFAAVMRALFLHHSSPMSVQPRKPQEIRGINTILISDPYSPNRMRPMIVKVEPGWSQE